MRRERTPSKPSEKFWGLAGTILVLGFAFQLYLAFSVHHIVNSTNTNLLNGKTSSAISAKKTEKLAGEIKILAQQNKVLAQQIKTLIENGKSAGAQASKRAAASAAAGNVILHQAEALIGSEIAANHKTGIANHTALCSLVVMIHDFAPTVTIAPAVTTDCKGVAS